MQLHSEKEIVGILMSNSKNQFYTIDSFHIFFSPEIKFQSFLINLQSEFEKVIKMTNTTNEEEEVLKSVEALSKDKKIPQQVCIKCKAEFNQGEKTCPHCGHSKWGIFIVMTIAGLAVVPIAIYFILLSIDDKGVVMEKLPFFLSVLGGFLGVVMLFSGLTSIRNAVVIRKRIKKNKQQEHN